MVLTDIQLRAVMPRVGPLRARAVAVLINAAMAEFAINTPLRAAHFLAQIAQETGELQWLREIWGPTKQQLKYEPPHPVATRLGNTEPGDGERFMGRGAIQLTGRANYAQAGKRFGVDLLSHPDLACGDDLAFRIAGAYWADRQINLPADADDVQAVTRRVNGGLTHLSKRIVYLQRAKAALNTPDTDPKGQA